MKKVLGLVCGAVLALTVNAAVADAADFGSADWKRPKSHQNKLRGDTLPSSTVPVLPGSTVPVPEPGSMLLLGAGLVALGVLRNRKQ